MSGIDKAVKYYEQSSKGEIDLAINKSLKNDEKEIVYGARSVNARMPKYLQKFTEDYDIYSQSPKETANEMEKLLDKEFGGDYFEVRPAKHEGTFKVVSKITSRGVADITLPDKTISYQTIDGINYATLDEQVANIKRSLADPESKFRWAKDEEAMLRIKVFWQKHPGLRKNTIKQMQIEESEGKRVLGEEVELVSRPSRQKRRPEPTPGITAPIFPPYRF